MLALIHIVKSRPLRSSLVPSTMGLNGEKLRIMKRDCGINTVVASCRNTIKVCLCLRNE